MILKVVTADRRGWIIISNIWKIRHTRISEKRDLEQMRSRVGVVEMEKKAEGKPDTPSLIEYCMMREASLTMLINTEAFLCTDEGKTIERIL